MKVTLIAAMSENRVIGRDNDVPWHLPDDLRHFKACTFGHHVVMGRRTWESVGKPLPGRTTIVVTRRDDFGPEGVLVASSLDAALALAPHDEEVFIAGGEQIYRTALPRADRMLLTLVHATVAGDTFFPEFDAGAWTVVEQERHEADATHEHSFTFVTYEKGTVPASSR